MMDLWTPGDIAARLGISASLVSNWGHPGTRRIPEPYAITQRGNRLWTTEQADQIVTEYQEWREQKQQRKADEERARRMLGLLTSRPPV